MSKSSPRISPTKPYFSTLISGFPPTKYQVIKWLLYRNMPQSEIDAAGGVRLASMMHYYDHRTEDPPDVVPLPLKCDGQISEDNDEFPKYYLLVG
jgi:hypothetical protein